MSPLLRFIIIFPVVIATFMIQLESNIIAHLKLSEISMMPNNAVLSLIAAIFISLAISKVHPMLIATITVLCVLMNFPTNDYVSSTFINQQLWGAILLVILILPNSIKSLEI